MKRTQNLEDIVENVDRKRNNKGPHKKENCQCRCLVY